MMWTRRDFVRGISAAALSTPAFSLASVKGVGTTATTPVCERADAQRFNITGPVSQYVSGVIQHWLTVAPLSNPAMLDMFRDRDRQPLRHLEPWAGEFAGKYLTSAVQVYRVSRDVELRRFLEPFVAHLVSLQAEDGYLGPFPKAHRLTGFAPNVDKNGGGTWDAWGHYHVMLGLLLWFDETGDPSALRAAARIGDLLCAKFLTARLVDTGSSEMNLAVIHSLCLLYRRKRESRYLKLSQRILDEFSAKDAKGNFLAGNYLQGALAGQEFFQLPKPRWESLHPIMGLAELYWLTGNADCRRAFENIWWSIVKLDRHNNGGFSSGEQAQGNPYHQGAIETCCTIAWIALSIEMLRLTSSSIVADEIELSTLNSVLGLHSHTGRWVTYNTPMDGTRKASAHDIVFQARAGSPELNCCSVNGPRGLGMISDWALMRTKQALLLHWYGASTFTTTVSPNVEVTLRQETDYPRGNRIRLHVEPSKPAAFTLGLRIPYWSRTTHVRLNGKELSAAPGTYLMIDRRWGRRDVIDLELDFSFHYWSGEKECAGKTSVYRGPILLSYDRRFNEMDPDAVPELDASGLSGKAVTSEYWIPPILLLEFTTPSGQKLRLCDFASAGAGGSPYRSWLPIIGAPKHAFSRENPLGTGRT